MCAAAPSLVAETVGLYVALNNADFADTGMAFKYYEQPSTFTRALTDVAHCDASYDQRCAPALHPTGGVNEGGTSVIVYGEGFDAFRSDPELASCRWGAAITTPTAISAGAIVLSLIHI